MLQPYVHVDWLLHRFGFEPGEIERRRFLARHHVLICPRLYEPRHGAAVATALIAHNMVVEFARVSRELAGEAT